MLGSQRARARMWCQAALAPREGPCPLTCAAASTRHVRRLRGRPSRASLMQSQRVGPWHAPQETPRNTPEVGLRSAPAHDPCSARRRQGAGTGGEVSGLPRTDVPRRNKDLDCSGVCRHLWPESGHAMHPPVSLAEHLAGRHRVPATCACWSHGVVTAEPRRQSAILWAPSPGTPPFPLLSALWMRRNPRSTPPPC